MATISMLVLMALVAVGLLSLSGAVVRSGTVSGARAEARANARLALMLAIGELQKQAGPDQRITANAGILDADPLTPESDEVRHPHWTGVWDSWAAGSRRHGDDAASQHRTTGAFTRRQSDMRPTYEDHRADHFRAWLVSLRDRDALEVDSGRSLALAGVATPDATSGAVRLVGRGSVGDAPGNGPPGAGGDSPYVSAALLDVDPDRRPGTGRRGRYAWWVADESTKARILGDRRDLSGVPLDEAGLIDRIQSAGSTGHRAIGVLEALDDPAGLERAFTRRTLEVLAGGGPQVRGAFHAATPYSLGIMTDVREGGLKRDLNSLLERPIKMENNDGDWILYGFEPGDHRVPVHDLSAYYQCYREVVRFDNAKSGNPLAPSSLQLNNINFREGYNFTRDYTNLYRMPFAVKYQFLMSYIGVARNPNEITGANRDSHKLHVGVTPSVTFWNPYNLPLVLNTGADRSTQMRLFNIPFGITWRKSGSRRNFRSPQPNSLVWLTNRFMEGRGVSADDVDLNAPGYKGSDRDNGITLYLAGTKDPVVFQPGEVRTFSLRQLGDRTGYEGILNSNRYRPELEGDPGWDPTFFLELPRSERSSDERNVEPEFSPNSSDARKRAGGALTFRAADRIGVTIHAAGTLDMANGAAFHLFHRQSSTMYGGLNRGSDLSHMRRQFQLTSRLHTERQKATDNGFNESLMRLGMPDGSDTIELPPVRGHEIIGRHRPFLLVSLTAGCEVSKDVTSDTLGGRRFPSRPFLHSTPVQTCAWIDDDSRDSLYHHGWNWWVQDVNSVLEASVQVAPNNRSGYWGGGYTPEFGSSNVVQQEVPVTPIHSIAALSHAHLSGYSISDDILGGGYTGRDRNNFEGTTATGGNGLFPRTSQAIGNSYAHPYLAPDRAFGPWTRHFNVSQGPQQKPFADHSYLANKALWDEFFFSSIAPRQTAMFTRGRPRTAAAVARGFFFGDRGLPNARFVPYLNGLTEERLAGYFERDLATLAAVDELAAHLMVEGPFNVNSTSVDAWKALFASLRDRDVPVIGTSRNSDRLSRGIPVRKAPSSGGVPVGSATVLNGEPFTGSPSEPSSPEQWNSWRKLTAEEIDQLAVAMVKQVKLRGPFLSLSEFVNRRLDSDNIELALKGALQAAIDDPECDINAGFRGPERQFSEEELAGMDPAFPEALAGPVAYGSAAYIDQADILRGFGGQLTPRGDTFLVRAYGDSVDAGGTVRARAWCEAVVQRVPDYLEASADAPHLAFDALAAEANRRFGRPFRVVSFRWLAPDEV